MSFGEALDRVMFASYRVQRERGIAPERLRIVFGDDVDRFEPLFQEGR